MIQYMKPCMSPLYLLDLLTQASHDLPRTVFHALYQQISRSLLRRVGIRIPLQLQIPYTANASNRPDTVLRAVRAMIRQAPMPPPLKAYYQRILYLRSKAGPKVKDILCTTRLKCTWKQMNAFVAKLCGCHDLQGVNKVEGCVSTRMPDEWVAATAPTAQVAQQVLGNRTFMQWETLYLEAQAAVPLCTSFTIIGQ